VPQAGQLQVLDGPLFLNNGSTSSPIAGALGFAQGTDVSSGWATNNVAIIEGPSAPTFLSYRI
jgi:hypothetical protein